jgi:hypothetical protein
LDQSRLGFYKKKLKIASGYLTLYHLLQSISSIALVLASISSAQAEVIFNFVPTQFFGQSDRKFQVSVSDSFYTAAQSEPVTFGVFSVTGSFDPITTASVGPLSSDVTGTVTTRAALHWFF